MKTKWNFLMILALLVMLVGGNASPVQAEDVTLGDISVISLETDEATSSTIVGDMISANVVVTGYYEGLTCSVDFGDGSTENDTSIGWLNGDPQICYGDHIYKTAGTFAITVTISGPDGTMIGAKTAIHEVTYTDVGLIQVVMRDNSQIRDLEPSITNQFVSAIGFILPHQYLSTQSCTVDYGDGGVPVTGTLIQLGWVFGCQGPEHAYSTPGTYKVTVDLTGYNGTTATMSADHLVLPPPVLEQLPNQQEGAFADSGIWDAAFCTTMEIGCSAAENVVVPDGTRLTISHIQLWGFYTGENHDPYAYTDDFSVILHQDAAGLPGTVVYTENHVNSMRGQTGVTLGEDLDEFLVTLTLSTPQALETGTYWIEIYNTGGTPTASGIPANVFVWEAGDADSFDLGAEGVALWKNVEGNWTWVTLTVPNVGLSMRLFSPPAAPTAHSISGKVFDDQNTNGAFDTGEPGLADKEISVYKDCGPTAEATITTGLDGSYTFTGLEPGSSYCVWTVAPAGYKVILYPPIIQSLDADLTGINFGFTNLPLFSWTPTNPDEGGTATFTAVAGFLEYGWKTTQPGADCITELGTVDQKGQSVELSFGASGQYQVCLMMVSPAGWPIYDSQLVTVANVAPVGYDWAASIYPEPSAAGSPIQSAEAAFFDWDHLAECTVDYGDGTGPQAGTIYPEENACAGPEHTYAAAGTYQVTFTATDPDGASDSITIDHIVNAPEYQSAGFSAPLDLGGVLNTAKAGQMIPLKWRLLDGSGNPVTTLDTASVALSVNPYTCPSGVAVDSIETYATGTSVLQNLGDGYYQLNWKTDKGWLNLCKKLTLKISDWTGDGLIALFQFKK